MIRRIPILPTLIVLAAVAVMMRLGFWQLDRLAQKEALLASYAAASNQPAAEFEGWLHGAEETNQRALYRRAWVNCRKASEFSSRAGHNADGATGWAHLATCDFDEPALPGRQVQVVLGWSRDPVTVSWAGGEVVGTFGPGKTLPVLIADPPLAGLQANAKPNPANIPNNHLSYAVQWFLFALTALVIYALALRKRLGQSSPERGGGAPEA